MDKVKGIKNGRIEKKINESKNALTHTYSTTFGKVTVITLAGRKVRKGDK